MEKLIPIKKRGRSNKDNTNFLYKKGNTFLMDNHRMAAWCWANCLNTDYKYTIIHIDKHYDALGCDIDLLTSRIPNDFKTLSLKDYDELIYNRGFGPSKVFAWDNYIPIFHHFYSYLITNYKFYTHNIGTIAAYMKDCITHYSVYDLIENFPCCSEGITDKLIINVDIDYFFVESLGYSRFLSERVTRKIIDSIMKLADDPKNILTIALSPECCGNWGKSERFVKKYFSKYDIII